MFDDFTLVTADFLEAMNIAALICDIDNTLATYDDPDPPDGVIAWCGAMNARGIKIAFVSNNNAERVERFNKSFGYPAYHDSKKPSRKKLIAAMDDMNTTRANTAFLGDQILTDVLAAKRAGLYAIVVKPIKDKTSLFFKIKRLIEVPFINEYKRTHKDDENYCN
jgi:HAD superfamily (subfamily IIIA) phosphatase, TIGR01668